MNMKPFEIRNDDVLQTTLFTQAQKRALEEKSMFEWFLEADKVFEKYNHPCILAILAEGLTDRQWVEHIKKNQHRYIIELHGYSHEKYGRFGRQELYDNLKHAKDLIEMEFGVKVTTWYVPFGRKGRNPYAEEVCQELGLKLGIPNGKVDVKLWFKNKSMPHGNFHFWKRSQIQDVENVLKEIYGEKI